MYQTHWNLRSQPFRDAQRGGVFYQSAAHEEALARLYFLVEEHRRLGLLLGPGGCGKSLLLAVFAEALRHTGRPVAVLSLQGLQPAELVWELAVQFGLNPTSDALPALWRLLSDRLAEHRYQGCTTTVLLDDADLAEARTLDQILRLDRQATALAAELTVVLTAQADRLSHIESRLTDLADLRIELTPWDVDETEGYLKTSLKQAGCGREVFEPQAVARLQELSGGIPRRISQLADLALLAGAGQSLQQIDSEVVESVYRELGVPAVQS